MNRTCGAFAFVSFAVALAGCGKDAAPRVQGDFPGYPSPPLERLVKDAVAKEPVPSGGASYVKPAKIAVPALVAPNLGALPRDDKGRAILNEVSGVRLVLDPKKRDPITGMGRCVGRATDCITGDGARNARSLDACWMWTPICKTETPWTETEACCPARCGELYERLRTMGYPDLAASDLTADSFCFNSLTEFMGKTK